MSLWLDAASALSLHDALPIFALVGIWTRNYLEFRSKHPLGLLVFGLLLLAENCLSVYYYVVDPQVADLLRSAAPVAGRAMTFVQILELASILFLAWVTWD